MSRLFPLRTPVERGDPDPRVLDIDDDTADDVFGALSSDTARDILAATYEEPRPASELADAADTSLQNARYHLDKLSDAGLVEVADTWYSERGTEMKVYAPSNGPVAVVAGEDSRSLRDVLRAALAAVGLLGVLSGAVQWLATSVVPAGGPGGGQVQATPSVQTSDPGPIAAALAEPGVLFFAGGLVVLLLLGLWATRRHPR